MKKTRTERMASQHRMRSGRDFSEVRQHGAGYRGRFCLLLAQPKAGEPTRVGFIASKRGVGIAVKRNRARRRVREIVRRRWARVPHEGFLLVFILSRATLTAPHQELASEIERLLAQAGSLDPVSPS